MEPRRILVVANQTALDEDLMELLTARVAAGPSRITMLVPATPPHEHATWTEGDAQALARRRLTEAVDRMRQLGVEVEGVVGDANPVQAIDDLLRHQPHDEIVLSTLPAGLSRWLKLDVQHRIEQRFGLPLTTLTSRRHPVS